MGLFDTLKEPVFYKISRSAEEQLEALQKLREEAGAAVPEALEQEIRQVQAGIAGEKQIEYELRNSHMPMYVLHDLFLEHDGLTAQIDYLIITRFHNYVIECKNLYGDIEIDRGGNFVRRFSYGKYTKKEGIYSPVTQNRRHLDLIRTIGSAEKNNFFTKMMFEKLFYGYYLGIVVLANAKSVLNDRYAPKEIRDQVIKVDQLTSYIRKTDAKSKDAPLSVKDMENTAAFFLDKHQPNTVDYTEKFRKLIAEAAEKAEKPVKAVPEKENPAENDAKAKSGDKRDTQICPRCGAVMVRRKAKTGQRAGQEFYGCSNYPKCRAIVNID